MSTGNRNAVFQTRKLGQHFSSRNDRYLAPFRFLDFRIVGPDRRRSHNHVSAFHVFRDMAGVDRCSTLFQARGDRRHTHVRSGHPVAQVQ